MADETEGLIDWTDKDRWGEWSGVERGWHEIVLDLERRLRELVPGLRVRQVKEKFGGLRFYYACPEWTPGEMASRAHLLAAAAEERAHTVCERCGEPGRLREDRSWLLTLCEACHERMPGSDGRGFEAPDAALWRRVRLARTLREAQAAARDLERNPDELAACGLRPGEIETLERWWRAAVSGMGGLSSDQAPDPADQEARQLLRQLAGGAHMASFAAKKLRARYPDLFDQVGATVEDVRRLSMLWHGAMGTREALAAGDGGPDGPESGEL